MIKKGKISRDSSESGNYELMRGGKFGIGNITATVLNLMGSRIMYFTNRSQPSSSLTTALPTSRPSAQNIGSLPE